MKRVYVIVEGPTEESFINQVLAPVLWSREVYLTPIILGTPGHKGGRTSYARVKKHIVVQLKQDPTAHCSIMLDLYGLGEGFPATPLPPNLPNIEKVTRIEQAVIQDIIASVPASLRPDVRFLPYLQLHEYEGLLFSDPVAFANGIYKPNLAGQFQAIRSEFQTLRTSMMTLTRLRRSASFGSMRRIASHWTEHGQRRPFGIDTMLRECPHFREWVEAQMFGGED